MTAEERTLSVWMPPFTSKRATLWSFREDSATRAKRSTMGSAFCWWASWWTRMTLEGLQRPKRPQTCRRVYIRRPPPSLLLHALPLATPSMHRPLPDQLRSLPLRKFCNFSNHSMCMHRFAIIPSILVYGRSNYMRNRQEPL